MSFNVPYFIFHIHFVDLIVIVHELLVIYQFFNPLIERYDFLLSNDAKIVEFDVFVAILRIILVIIIILNNHYRQCCIY